MTVHAVVTTGPLGYVGNQADPFRALDGAHPVTRPLGVVDVRPAVSRRRAPGPDVSDTALPARVLAAYRSAALVSNIATFVLLWLVALAVGVVIYRMRKEPVREA